MWMNKARKDQAELHMYRRWTSAHRHEQTAQTAEIRHFAAHVPALSVIYIYIKIQFRTRRMQQEIISCVSFAQVWRQTRISGERLACRAGSAVPGPQYLVL